MRNKFGDLEEYYRKERKRENIKKFFKIFVIVFSIIVSLGVVIGLPVGLQYANYQEYTVIELTIFQDNDKTLYEITIDSGEKIILENEDLLFIGKTNSSSFGASLKNYEGNCNLKIATRGYRIPLFSTYQNIVSIELLGEQQ